MDSLSIEEAAIAGNSFGAAVALRIAAVAPERVSSLTLFSVPPVPEPEPSAELSAAWSEEEAALEAGDIDGAVDAVVRAWTGPDAIPALHARVARMQRRNFESQPSEEPEWAPDPLEEEPELLRQDSRADAPGCRRPRHGRLPPGGGGHGRCTAPWQEGHRRGCGSSDPARSSGCLPGTDGPPAPLTFATAPGGEPLAPSGGYFVLAPDSAWDSRCRSLVKRVGGGILRRIRGNLSYANVMATVAVFLALGGGAYAAVHLPRNSVGVRQLKRNSVSTAKVRDGATTGPKLDLSTLGAVPRAARADDASALAGVAARHYVTPSSTLASGDTEVGVFAASAPAGSVGSAAATFVPKLPEVVEVLSTPRSTRPATPARTARGRAWPRRGSSASTRSSISA